MPFEKYEVSYTKKVVDALGDMNYVAAYHRTVLDAMELLRQYHSDLHMPYEQRDEAIAELRAAEDTIRRQCQRLIDKDDEITRIRAALAKAHWGCGIEARTYTGAPASWNDVIDRLRKRAPNKPVPKQTYMACGHYPNALSNYFEHRIHCEFCCEKEPLKWYDNGRHREPSK